MRDARLSVCVCTFRRPELLAELLAALARQEGLDDDVGVEVVVVDNDVDGSAAPVIASMRARSNRFLLRDFVEPVQNIALARNRAVAEARGEWIAFIDDDEVPARRWLAQLRAAARRFAADGVFGPVLPLLPDGAPRWIAAGRFFDRPRHPTGAAVPTDELRTGNVLLRRAVLDGVPGPFEPAYGRSGGEDTVLFEHLVGTGARFVWCDEAAVHERVPPARARLGFVLRRSFGGGHGHARHVLGLRGVKAVPTLLVRGAGALASAPLVALASLPFGVHHAVRWCCLGAGGAGKLLGLTPVEYHGY
jgi:succinoglycan biosynthesis protein ExoM